MTTRAWVSPILETPSGLNASSSLASAQTVKSPGRAPRGQTSVGQGTPAGCLGGAGTPFTSVEVFFQDCHLEHEGAVLVLILIDDADELALHLHFSAVLLFRARLHRHVRVAEGALQVRLEPLDVCLFHEADSPGQFEREP